MQELAAFEEKFFFFGGEEVILGTLWDGLITIFRKLYRHIMLNFDNYTFLTTLHDTSIPFFNDAHPTCGTRPHTGC